VNGSGNIDDILSWADPCRNALAFIKSKISGENRIHRFWFVNSCKFEVKYCRFWKVNTAEYLSLTYKRANVNNSGTLNNYEKGVYR